MSAPTLNKDTCTSCSICVGECPTEAIAMVDNYPVIDEAKCTACNACVDGCPTQALTAGA